jgi:F-type H+-transporting ATPase subunit b
MIQIDFSLAVSALIFLVTLFALNKILFRPLFRVIKDRQAQTSDLFDAVSESEEYRTALLDQYHQKIREAKQAGYRLADGVRTEAQKARQARIAEARQEAEGLMDQAKADIDRDLQEARARLRDDAGEIALLISDRVLKN